MVKLKEIEMALKKKEVEVVVEKVVDDQPKLGRKKPIGIDKETNVG